MGVSAMRDRADLAWIGYLLFFDMLALPTTYYVIKTSLLVAALVVVLMETVAQGRLRLHHTVVLWTLAMALCGIGWVALGFVRNTPGALAMVNVYVIWPLVFLLFAGGVSRLTVIDGLLRVIAVTAIAISVYTLLFVLHTLHVLPSWAYVNLDLGQGVGFYSGYVELRLYSLSSLLFLVPFCVAALMLWPRREPAPVSRLLLWLGALLGTLVVLISGRRGLILVFAVAPLLVVLLRRATAGPAAREGARLSRRALLAGAVGLVGVAVVLNLLGAFQWASFWRMFTQGFQFQRSVSSLVRRRQMIALLSGWAEHPLFGAGTGAQAYGWQSSQDMPWTYEMIYVSMLFHAGVVGLAVYTAGIAWIVLTGIKVVREAGPMAMRIGPVLIGMACFLIASGTNPYLEKFDYIWVIFLPVAMINTWLLSRPPAAA